MKGHDLPLWLIVGGRVRIGRWIAEDFAVDHRLLLSSSHPWDEELWTHEYPHIEKLFHWDAHDPNLLSSVDKDMQQLKMHSPSIDGVCFVASTFPKQPLGSWTRHSLEETLRTNLVFPMLITQGILPFLSPHAQLHFLSDYAADDPFPQRLPYSAGKSGLANVVQGLKKILPPTMKLFTHKLGTIQKAISESTEHAAVLHTPPQSFESLIEALRK